MTIPQIIAKYEQTIIINSMRKVYSDFNRALKLAEVDYGDMESWEWGALAYTPEFVDKYLAPYFKSVTKCGKGTWTNPNSTTPLKKPTAPLSCGFPCANGWKKMNGECANETGYFYYLFNGIPTGIRLTKSSCVNGGNHTCSPELKSAIFFIDVDGVRGKGIMGKDVHAFTLYNYTYKSKFGAGNGKHYGLKLGTECGNHGCYTKSIQDLYNGSCNINNTSIHSGKDCGLVIEKSGWKIPKDYPIKF